MTAGGIDSGRTTGKPEVTREQAGIARNSRSVACGLSVFPQFSPTNLRDTVGTVWSLPDSERKHFRTINVQWIGQ
jgi:hypothetical protein